MVRRRNQDADGDDRRPPSGHHPGKGAPDPVPAKGQGDSSGGGQDPQSQIQPVGKNRVPGDFPQSGSDVHVTGGEALFHDHADRFLVPSARRAEIRGGQIMNGERGGDQDHHEHGPEPGPDLRSRRDFRSVDPEAQGERRSPGRKADRMDIDERAHSAHDPGPGFRIPAPLDEGGQNKRQKRLEEKAGNDIAHESPLDQADLDRDRGGQGEKQGDRLVLERRLP